MAELKLVPNSTNWSILPNSFYFNDHMHWDFPCRFLCVCVCVCVCGRVVESWVNLLQFFFWANFFDIQYFCLLKITWKQAKINPQIGYICMVSKFVQLVVYGKLLVAINFCWGKNSHVQRHVPWENPCERIGIYLNPLSVAKTFKCDRIRIEVILLCSIVIKLLSCKG